MDSFRQLFYQHSGKMIHKWDHYLDIYERHFAPFRGKEITMLEIGVNHGGSLQLWKKYFGDQIKVYGVDVNPECKALEEENVKIFIGSQEDRRFLQELKAQIPQVDILLDDGGHTMNQQKVTFEELFSHVKDGGLYVCEDIHTSYWYEFHGGYKKKGSFIEYSKNFIDKVNAWHSRDKDKLDVDSFTRNATGLHFYDSVLIIDKNKREEPYHVRVGQEMVNVMLDATLKKQTLWMKAQKAVKKRLGKAK